MTIKQISEEQLNSLSQHLNSTPKGRENWNKLSGAWNKKKRRSKNNGKKYKTFELSRDAHDQLKYLARDISQEAALEKIILGHFKEEQDLRNKKLWDDKCTMEQIDIAKLKNRINELEINITEEKEKVKKLEQLTNNKTVVKLVAKRISKIKI
nr:Occludin homology domain [Moritella viscosa]SHO15463.1 Occludin homology domain [Moritella viscosa]SHO19225.1 Occludin homology domain [Moritella viscosa]